MRPVLSLPASPQELLLDVIATLGIFFCCLLPVLAWSTLPEMIPRHYGADGLVDAWGSKWVLIYLPGVAVLVYGILSWLAQYPHWLNYPWEITEQNARQQYYLARLLLTWLKVETMWICCFVEWKLIQVALARALTLGVEVIPITLLVLLGTLGIYWWQASLVR